MAYGNITTASIDSWVFPGDLFDFVGPSICHAIGNKYAVACLVDNLQPTIKTVAVSNAGIITKSYAGSQAFESFVVGDLCPYIRITKINNGMVAIAYGCLDNSINYFRVKTCSVATDGTLTSVGSVNIALDGTSHANGSWVNVSGNTWAVATRERWGTGPYTRGIVVRTFTITSAGAITLLNTAMVATTYSGALDYLGVMAFALTKLSTTLYAITYTGPFGAGYENAPSTLVTFTMTPGGAISAAVDTQVLAVYVSTAIQKPVIWPISGNVYATTYENASANAEISTFTISSTGTITDTPIDTWSWEAVSFGGGYQDIIHSDVNKWTLAYRKDYYLRVATFSVTDAGTITEALFDQATTLSSDSRAGNVINIIGDYYIIGNDSAGYSVEVITIQVSSQPTSPANPSQPLPRVSALVHRWSSGVDGNTPTYRLEIMTGGLSSYYQSPLSEKVITPSIPSQPMPLPRDPYAGNTLFDYATWLSQHTYTQIIGIWGHRPSYDEWMAYRLRTSYFF